MKKWQYREAYWHDAASTPNGKGFVSGTLHDSFTGWINGEGERGWELVSVLVEVHGRRAIFKKELV
jgi:hypothetical protein